MFRSMWCAMAFAVAALPAQAQESDTAKMREELRQLQQRLQQLERRLQETEAKSGKAEEAAQRAESTAVQAAAQASSRPQSESALNPGVSVILNGVYGNFSRDPNTYRLNGFVPTMGDVAAGRRGLSLGESELAFMSNIDHMFRGTLIGSISPDNSSIDVEEGYIQTIGLSHGFTIKAGRFFSAVGYQNQIHAHAWDFTDTPLAMKVFLGNQLNEDGLQFPSGVDRNKNGFGSTNLFTHLGGDLGQSIAWQTGLSHLRTSPQDRTYEDVVTNSFTGNSRLWVLDGVLKWAPNGNPTYNNFKLQGEYFRRNEDGNLTFNTAGAALTDGLNSRQSGWYLQGVYQFLPQWRFGYRYDRLDSGTTNIGLVNSGALGAADFPILEAYRPKRHTAMIDWNPSEFSRIRLQFARDYSRLNQPDNQLLLQYIVSLGAHGAHKF